MPVDLQQAERALRAAHEAGDVEAARKIAQGIRQMQAAALQHGTTFREVETAPGVTTRVPTVTAPIGGPPVNSDPPERGAFTLENVLAGPSLAIARDPVQYGRDLAGEAAQMGATGL